MDCTYLVLFPNMIFSVFAKDTSTRGSNHRSCDYWMTHSTAWATATQCTLQAINNSCFITLLYHHYLQDFIIYPLGTVGNTAVKSSVSACGGTLACCQSVRGHLSDSGGVRTDTVQLRKLDYIRGNRWSNGLGQIESRQNEQKAWFL